MREGVSPRRRGRCRWERRGPRECAAAAVERGEDARGEKYSRDRDISVAYLFNYECARKEMNESHFQIKCMHVPTHS